MQVTLQIRDEAAPLLRAALGALRSGSIERAMGQGVANLVRNHLFAKNATPNQLGGRRTNFYARAARSVNLQSARPGEAVVSINHLGLRQRWQGGVIRPVRGNYLTIPAVSEAHGRRAREFKNLRVSYNRAGRPAALVEAEATRLKFGRKRADGSRRATSLGGVGGRVFFWLVPEVNQQPDPSVLPDERRMLEAALQAGRDRVAAALQGGSNAR